MKYAFGRMWIGGVKDIQCAAVSARDRMQKNGGEQAEK